MMKPQQQQPKQRICGTCREEILDLEPAQCSCCEIYFHVALPAGQQGSCNDASRTHIRALYGPNIALWLCIKCRLKFANRTLHSFLEAKIKTRAAPVAPPDEISALRTQVDELIQLVGKLKQQMDNNHAAVTAKLDQTPPTTDWPLLSTASLNNSPMPSNVGGRRGRANRPFKRRRGSNGEIPETGFSRPAIPCGTGDIDLSDLQLSCPIAPATPPPKLWLYLSGFNPRISDDDVKKITKHCLGFEGDIEASRLVPKDADTSSYTFVSFRVGLDLTLKTKALDLSTWPRSIRVREFIRSPKNVPSLPADPTHPAELSEQQIVINGTPTDEESVMETSLQ